MRVKPVKAKKLAWRERKARRNKSLQSYPVKRYLEVVEQAKEYFRRQRANMPGTEDTRRWSGPIKRSPAWPHIMEMYAVAPGVDGL